MPTPDLSLLIYCRDDPVSARWVGIDALLSEFQCDQNVYTLATGVQWLLDNYTLTVSLATITQPTPSTLLFTMTDATTQGPFDIPVSTFRDRGDWAVATPYLINDTFNAPDGGLYRVIFGHTSDPTSFDPNANDGIGHDYYAKMITAPGNALPAGGATAQVLQKSSGTDYAVMWGYKLPTGGTGNQVLVKQSATNQDADWETLTAAIVDFNPSSASALVSTNVSDALEELEAGLGSATLSGLSDVVFELGDPQLSQMLYYDGAEWTATPVLTDGQFLVYDSGAGAFVAADPATPVSVLDDLTDTVITAADVGDTLVFDGASSKWVNRQSYQSIGSTGANVTMASTDNFSTIKFTPSGSLQLVNGANGHRGEKTTVIIATSGTSSYNITAGTNVKMASTLATGVTDGKYWTLTFTSDGVTLFETGRTGPM